jgi:hypothetical protein
LARHVSRCDRLLGFLGDLPADRRQPNLLFAAVRQVAGLPSSAQAFEESVLLHAGSIATVMQSHTTQTNEPGRCAVLLPVLVRLRPPLAILEVGASAGLCLLPDRYGYDYGRCRIEPPKETRLLAPVFPCVANESTPLPTTLPSVGWRMGLDLNPLCIASPPDMDWLRTLIWPEQLARRERFEASIETALQDPPTVTRGNLRRDMQAMLSAAPTGMTLVVFHTAVLAYVSPQSEREAFARTVKASGATWISNEAPEVYPDIAARVPGTRRPNRFLLAVDGEPVAWTGPHGQSIEWFAG